ncbi:Fic family protein [Vineibacter terrae]|uniref:Fic family protein n=1 Tax=Vineibacter terrae TaxID=2586908 RepID=A0A5C8PU95_9HYPH|nr:Fic family protein [Vineibacter terrae]TXL80487.1 Fic family protein [Vineibacter terrae]
MGEARSAKEPAIESVQRIEPARLEDLPEALSDIVAELAAASAKLGHSLHPRTAGNLAGLVRIMNTYYSNLIEGHDTRPKDIERALAGQFHRDKERRDLQVEAAAHVRVQAAIDLMNAEDRLPEPTSVEFIQWLHREFYRDAPEAMLRVGDNDRDFLMEPGVWRSRPEQDVAVGRHLPPSSHRVPDFIAYFSERYRSDRLGKAARILAIPAAHHRFNYIHPFPDGNGRVSRLMSHAMAHLAGIGAHGLWSISRGLVRGLESRGDYKRMMDHADMPRQGDLDGRGNLSQRALIDFTAWFLRVCLDQVTFMSSLFELDTLARRLRAYVERSESLKPEATRLLEEALIRGEFERGEIPRITGLPERTARRVFNDVVAAGLLASETPKGRVSLRFPVDTLDLLFPRLFSAS